MRLLWGYAPSFVATISAILEEIFVGLEGKWKDVETTSKMTYLSEFFVNGIPDDMKFTDCDQCGHDLLPTSQDRQQ